MKVNDFRRIGGCVGSVSELDMEPVQEIPSLSRSRTLTLPPWAGHCWRLYRFVQESIQLVVTLNSCTAQPQ